MRLYSTWPEVVSRGSKRIAPVFSGSEDGESSVSFGVAVPGVSLGVVIISKGARS